MLAAIVLTALPSSRPLIAGGLPLVAGNTAIADRILHGDAHLLLLGDSLQYRNQVPEYLSHWPVDAFSGQVASANLCGYYGFGTVGTDISPGVASSVLPAWLGSQTMVRRPNDPPAADGYTGISPGATTHFTLAAAEVPRGGSIGNNTLLYAELSANQAGIYGSTWAMDGGGQINIDVLTYNNPGGLASGLRFDVWNNRLAAGEPIASVPISTYADSAGLVRTRVSVDVPTWDAGTCLLGAMRIQEGLIPRAGANVIFAGARFTTGTEGLQFACAAQGSMGVNHFLSDTNVTDANLATFLEYTDTNTILAWLGANDLYMGATAWKTQMERLIARYKTARPGMQFVLVSTYDLGNLAQPDFAQSACEIALADSDVLFLDLYGTAGDYAFLRGKYLADKVHQNAAGSDYMAKQVASLLETAAAVPEPRGMAVLCGIAAVLRRRGLLRRTPAAARGRTAA